MLTLDFVVFFVVFEYNELGAFTNWWNKGTDNSIPKIYSYDAALMLESTIIFCSSNFQLHIIFYVKRLNIALEFGL